MRPLFSLLFLYSPCSRCWFRGCLCCWSCFYIKLPFVLTFLLANIVNLLNSLFALWLPVELFGALRGRLSDSNKNLVMATLTTIGSVATAMGPAVEKSSKVCKSYLHLSFSSRNLRVILNCFYIRAFCQMFWNVLVIIRSIWENALWML